MSLSTPAARQKVPQGAQERAVPSLCLGRPSHRDGATLPTETNRLGGQGSKRHAHNANARGAVGTGWDAALCSSVDQEPPFSQGSGPGGLCLSPGPRSEPVLVKATASQHLWAVGHQDEQSPGLLQGQDGACLHAGKLEKGTPSRQGAVLSRPGPTPFPRGSELRRPWGRMSLMPQCCHILRPALLPKARPVWAPCCLGPRLPWEQLLAMPRHHLSLRSWGSSSDAERWCLVQVL